MISSVDRIRRLFHRHERVQSINSSMMIKKILVSSNRLHFWDKKNKTHSGLLRRRIHSDPIHQTDVEFSASYLLGDVQSNHSYSIEDNSSYEIPPEDFLANDHKLVQKEEKQEMHSINLVQSLPPRLPYSSLLWPRKGQTLDHYIREYDSQTLTDVEKVRTRIG